MGLSINLAYRSVSNTNKDC